VGTTYRVAMQLIGRDNDVPGLQASYKSLGSNGAEGGSTNEIKLETVNRPYHFMPGIIFNVDASSVIHSHADIMAPEIAWLGGRFKTLPALVAAFLVWSASK